MPKDGYITLTFSEVLIEDAIDRLKKCDDMDQELGHIEADQVLLDILKKLMFDEVVVAYEKIEKWYA